jgi:hypothetical protein
MALYKDSVNVNASSDAAFDQEHQPGIAAPFAGIYRCAGCGHEIGIAATHTLPSQNHPQHGTNQGKIRWKLLVFAQHKAA